MIRLCLKFKTKITMLFSRTNASNHQTIHSLNHLLINHERTIEKRIWRSTHCL